MEIECVEVNKEIEPDEELTNKLEEYKGNLIILFFFKKKFQLSQKILLQKQRTQIKMKFSANLDVTSMEDSLQCEQQSQTLEIWWQMLPWRLSR